MKSFLFVMAVASLLAGAIQSKDTTIFRVDSYVPTKFTDLRWRLSGGTDLNGGSGDENYTFSDYPNKVTNSTHRDYQRIDIFSDLGYRFYTTQFSYDIALNNDMYFGHSKGLSSSVRDLWGPYREEYETERSSTHWGFSLAPSVGLTRYISGDLYAKGSLSVQFMYNYVDFHSESGTHGYNITDSVVYASSISEDTKRYDINGFTSVSTEIGFGRIYSGEFAFTAMSIIRELESADLILRNPTAHEMRDLCDTILEYRQRHIVDKRFRRVAALKAILGYLQSIQAIGEIDAYLPFVLSDIWDYYPRTSRSFGYQISSGIELNYMSSYWQEDYLRTNSGNQYSSGERYGKEHSGRAAILGSLTYAKPLSYHWQLDIRSNVWYVANKFTEVGFESPVATDRGFVAHRSSASLAYYHDARTTMGVSVGTERNVNQYYSRNVGNRSNSTALSASGTYRISVPTTFTISLGSLWESTKSDNTASSRDDHRYQLTARIEHWLY